MIFGAPISVGQFLLYNLLPVTLGNLFAGALFTGVALYTTYPSAPMHPAVPAQLAAPAQAESAFSSAVGLNPM
jgi:formate transporter